MAIFCQAYFPYVDVIKFFLGMDHSRLTCLYLSNAVFVKLGLDQSLFNDHHLIFTLPLPAISIGILKIILNLVQNYLLSVYVPISLDLYLFRII